MQFFYHYLSPCCQQLLWDPCPLTAHDIMILSKEIYNISSGSVWGFQYFYDLMSCKIGMSHFQCLVVWTSKTNVNDENVACKFCESPRRKGRHCEHCYHVIKGVLDLIRWTNVLPQKLWYLGDDRIFESEQSIFDFRIFETSSFDFQRPISKMKT